MLSLYRVFVDIQVEAVGPEGINGMVQMGQSIADAVVLIGVGL